MRIFRSVYGLMAMALAVCLPSFAVAADARPDLITAVRYAVADVGHYGTCAAKANAELAYQVSADSVSSGVGEGLTKMSNGFVQKALAVREVAEGTTGSTASSQLS